LLGGGYATTHVAALAAVAASATTPRAEKDFMMMARVGRAAEEAETGEREVGR
jgi:hypothetical protein